MRQRHLPFEIDEEAKEVWLQCFAEVLEGAQSAYGFPPQHMAGFRTWLQAFAGWMVNTREDQTS